MAWQFTWSMLSLVSRYSCWLVISFFWISSCMLSCCTSSLLFSSSSLNCSSCSSRLQIWCDEKTRQELQRKRQKTVWNVHRTDTTGNLTPLTLLVVQYYNPGTLHKTSVKTSFVTNDCIWFLFAFYTALWLFWNQGCHCFPSQDWDTLTNTDTAPAHWLQTTADNISSPADLCHIKTRKITQLKREQHGTSFSFLSRASLSVCNWDSRVECRASVTDACCFFCSTCEHTTTTHIFTTCTWKAWRSKHLWSNRFFMQATKEHCPDQSWLIACNWNSDVSISSTALFVRSPQPSTNTGGQSWQLLAIAQYYH